MTLTAFQRDRYATLAVDLIERYDFTDEFNVARTEFLNDCRAELRGEYPGDAAGFETAVEECEEIFTATWNDTSGDLGIADRDAAEEAA